jgi:hypothetical protein
MYFDGMNNERPADLLLQLLRQAAALRQESDQHFRATVVAARAGGVPLAPIAEAAGLSVARIHAILREETAMQVGSPPMYDAPEAADDVVIVAARIAYEEYVHHGAYVCQQGRTFRDAERVGFYRHGNIERHFPEIRAIEDDILFTRENARRLRETGSQTDRDVADVIDAMLDRDERGEGDVLEVVLLTPHDDHRTLTLGRAIRHDGRGRGSAWTMGQRYASEAALRRNPATTNDL